MLLLTLFGLKGLTKMKKPFPVLAFITLFVLAFAASASAQSSADKPKNEIEARGIFTIPTGSANFSGTTNSGSTVDFRRDFDFNTRLGLQLRYAYRSTNGKHKIVADYNQTSWNRDRIIGRSFVFQGQTYLANAQIDSNLKLRTFRLMYAYRWGNEKFRIGPMIDVGVVNTHLELNGITATGTRSTEGGVSKFAATVGYDIDYDAAPNLQLFHNLGLIKFSGDHLFHTEAGVKFFPSRHFGASGGYKWERYRFEENDPNFLKVNQHGPFFGGVVRF